MSIISKLFAHLLLASICGCTANEVVIATLFAPSQGATLAPQSYEAAVELAVSEYQEKLRLEKSSTKVRLVKGTLDVNPDITLSNFKNLLSQGIKLFVGPAESSQLLAIMAAANANDAVIISNASTSPTLAIPNDNIYRLIPNDILQTEKLAKQIYDNGFSNLLIIARQDLYGDDFRNKLERAFEILHPNNRVTEDIYNPLTTNFSEYVAAWIDNIQATPINPNDTALVLVSFEEIVPMVKEMIIQNSPLFASFRWYGGDGVAQIPDVIADNDVANFLRSVNFLATSPTVYVNDEPLLDVFYTKLENNLVNSRSIFAATAYDAANLLIATQLSLKSKNQHGIAAFKAELVTTAATMEGATGNLEFNAAGDRNLLPYALWGITQTGPLNWTLVTPNLP